MATNTLNTIYEIEQQITKLETELKALRAQEKDLIEKALKTGSTENRYYMLTSRVRKGDRVIDVKTLEEKYPEVYRSCIRVSVNVTDAQKLLGDSVIDQISTRKPDSVSWYVTKKPSEPIQVV